MQPRVPTLSGHTDKHGKLKILNLTVCGEAASGYNKLRDLCGEKELKSCVLRSLQQVPNC